MIRRSLPLLLSIAAVAVPASADAAVSQKKAIAGPVEFSGASQFSTYRALGAGIYQATLDRREIAQQDPADPKDPMDPGYEWPSDMEEGVHDAKRFHIRIALTITGASKLSAPKLAAFATAAARQYPTVRLWLVDQGDTTATPAYAKQLDAVYGALKARNAGNLVLGMPNSASTVAKLNVAAGKNARMDMLASEPADNRSLKASTVKSLHASVDNAYGKPLKLFLTGWTLQTGRSAAAGMLAAGLKVARQAPYVYALGYDGLVDPNTVGKDGRIPRTGLLDPFGEPRPAFAAFKKG